MSDFNGQLGKYKIVQTGDESPTLWSEYFDENCHSTHGAYSETLTNYIEACQVKTRPANSKFCILEVGFGLGMGLKTTLQEAPPSPEHPLHFVSLELDSALVEWSRENLKIQNFDLSQLKKINDHYHFHSDQMGLTIDILIGDARQTLKMWNEAKFDAIYQDPFSPKKNPTLWSVEWFEVLRQKSKQNVLMATYSASVGVRKAMLEANWHPHSLKGFGPKRERTLAKLVGPADESLERRLRASAAPALRDQA